MTPAETLTWLIEDAVRGLDALTPESRICEEPVVLAARAEVARLRVVEADAATALGLIRRALDATEGTPWGWGLETLSLLRQAVAALEGRKA